MQNRHKCTVALWLLVLILVLPMGIKLNRSERDGRKTTYIPILYGYGEVCGNNDVEDGEECDDGDTDNGDGCDSSCEVETGWTCTGDPSSCSATCGDGLIKGSEECDDSDTDSGDGCSSTCTEENGYSCSGEPSTCSSTCGDGLVASDEGCDDSGTTAGDGCSATCTVESGYSCTGEPSSCSVVCGDGLIKGSEGCDDGDSDAGDGCSDSCTVETGFSCSGEPSSCSSTCGDGTVASDEACDDGGTTAGDGCSATCALESGYTCTGTPSSCSTTCGDGVVAGTEECEPPGSNDCSDACIWNTGGGGSSGGSSTSGRAIRRRHGGSDLVIEVLCGNDRIDIGEECDDGNQEDLDGCSSFCNREIGECGDGIIQRALGEECEPEFTINSEGKKEYPEMQECSEEEELTVCTEPESDLGGCLLVTVPECGAPPPIAEEKFEPFCGDGRKDPGEECDFGGVCFGGKYNGAVWRDRSGAMLCRLHGGISKSRSGDGCSDECRLEYCGDNVLQFTEQCDNGTACSNEPTRECTSNAMCEEDGKCTYNNIRNRACTRTCELCQGLYTTTLGIDKFLEGEHILKVQITNRKGLWTVWETSFDVTKTLLLTQEPGPVHYIDVQLKEASSEQEQLNAPLISIITDKKSYIKGFNKAMLVSVIAANGDGSLLTGLPISAFVLALNGQIIKDVVFLESWGEECGVIAGEQARVASPAKLHLQNDRE